MNTISKDNYEISTNSGAENFSMLDLIDVLGNDFSNIYCVDRESQNIDIYRYENPNVGVKEVLKEKQPYKIAIQRYIEANVFQDDKEKMKVATELEHICRQLKQMPQFTVHYRVKRSNEIAFYRMKCARIGNADSFRKIIFAFASEDADVRLNELGIMMKSSGATGKRKILIVEDNELNMEMLSSLLENKYDVLTAENGKIGMQLLEEHYKELSLILLNVQMPVLNGIDFLKKMQEDALLSSVPVIVLTASNEMDTELMCLDLGAADYITKPYNSDIIRKRIRNVIRLKESSLTLEALEHDELTGLYTEAAFLHYVKEIMKFKPDKRMHLLVAKIKDFKLINSVYGLKRADTALCYLSSVYRKVLKNGLLARKGSSSFVCLFYGNEKKNREKIREMIGEIAENSPIAGLKVKYGIYENIDERLPVSTICDYASMAAETVMENYDCDLAFYTEEIAQKRIYNQMIENSFEEALKQEQFMVYYQPKIDIHTEKVTGAEALVRWKKDDGTMISPGDFIPVYEKDGLIAKLDEYVFRQVCSLQKDRLDKGQKLIPVSVNLSRSSVLHRNLAERYIEIVKQSGIPFSCVPIELTESASIYNSRVQKMAEKLVKKGVVLHIDDFGAGYSSLSCLNQFPFSTLKIDKSLIDHVCEEKGKTLVEQVVMLARLLKMKVIAEGVETKEQIEVLRKMKCDEIQGFYYAGPMPEKEFAVYERENG